MIGYALALVLTLTSGQAPHLCRPLPPAEVTAERAERERILVQALQAHLAHVGDEPVTGALYGLIPCLKVTPVPGDDRVGAVRLASDGIWLAGDHLVYRDGAAWRVQPLRVGRWPRYIQPKRAARTPRGLELLAHGDGGGSGGAGMVQLYRLGKEMELLWEGSPSGDHLHVLPLGMDYVITIDRAPQTYREPHAYRANCCLPVDRETIWHRLDDRYRPASERLIPNPYRAVSLFVGALRAGDRLTAAQHATSSEVVEQGARALQEIDYHRWGSMDRGWQLELGEALAWDVIPPHLRRPEPGTRQVIWPAGKVELVTVRQNGQWKVSAVRHAGRP